MGSGFGEAGGGRGEGLVGGVLEDLDFVRKMKDIVGKGGL